MFTWISKQFKSSSKELKSTNYNVIRQPVFIECEADYDDDDEHIHINEVHYDYDNDADDDTHTHQHHHNNKIYFLTERKDVKLNKS